MSISERFITYYRETFFSWDEEWLQKFLSTIITPLKKSFRINISKISIENLLIRLKNQGYIPFETWISNVFSFERTIDFNPFERRLGFSLEHLLWYIYIQELAAAHSVHILSDWKIHNDSFLILDMASSPGWKTTQLSEQYPKSFIIANEPTRERIPQLLQNLDRMGSINIGVTLYPGQYFATSPETFDRILLDAPCSWEWTIFKTTDAVKNWHIKNVKTISRLQEKLLESACISLKTWGEMVYSTCTLNQIENEWVLDSMMRKFPWCFEITFQKRYWPHIDGTGWFFVSKIRKLLSVEGKKLKIQKSINEEIIPLSKHEQSLVFDFFHSSDIQEYVFYKFKHKLLAVRLSESLELVRNNFYCMRFGEEVGNIEEGKIVWTHYAGKTLVSSKVPSMILPDDEGILDLYFRWEKIYLNTNLRWYINLYYDWQRIGLDYINETGILSNFFPPSWRRK